MASLRQLRNSLTVTWVTVLLALAIVASPAAQAQTFSVIHNFTGGGDGALPEAGVTVRGGILYGTTFGGGNGHGAVYAITHSGSDWVTLPISILSTGGTYPVARVVFGPDGHPYGTTQLGGSHNAGLVFDLIPPLTICKTASCYWKENILYEFQGGDNGAEPLFGDLVWDPQGNIYGTTSAGGFDGYGTVYELQPSGNSWVQTIIHRFLGPDGISPHNGVVFGPNGGLYGTTEGSLGGAGTVFELTYIPGVGWQHKLLYEFTTNDAGGLPRAGVIFDNSGNLYGATSDAGAEGGGTVFELMPSGNSYTFKLLYSFSGDPSCGPFGTLTMDAAGALYGTTHCEGANHFGSVFKLTGTGNGWVYTSLHDFSGSDGQYPTSKVTIDADGTLYGTASRGGSQNMGVVWMIKP